MGGAINPRRQNDLEQLVMNRAGLKHSRTSLVRRKNTFNTNFRLVRKQFLVEEYFCRLVYVCILIQCYFKIRLSVVHGMYI